MKLKLVIEEWGRKDFNPKCRECGRHIHGTKRVDFDTGTSITLCPTCIRELIELLTAQ